MANVATDCKSIALKVSRHCPAESVGESGSQLAGTVTVSKTANIVGFETLNRPLVHESATGSPFSRVPTQCTSTPDSQNANNMDAEIKPIQDIILVKYPKID